MPESFYDAVEDFEHGLAIVRLGDHCGVIDQSGNVIIPVEFDTVYVYNYGWIQATKNKVEYLYNSTGEQLLQLPGLVWWYVPREGIIRAKKQTGWGALNMKAEIIIPFQYVSLGPCINGWLSFYENGKWGWLDKQGTIVVPAQHLEVGVWSDKIWWSRNKNGYTLYNYSCNMLHDEGWTKILEPANGMAAVKTVDGWKYIDDEFNNVLQLPPIYEWVEHFDGGIAAVKRNGLWGFINASGNEVIKPAFDKVSRFREELCAVQVGEYWGFINMAGELVIPASYRGVSSFKEDKAWVRDSWNEWHIDKEGNDVTERKYWE